jgi:hypothetical protein
MTEIEAQIEQLLKQNVGVQRIKAQLHVGQDTILAVKERLGIKSTKNNPKPAAPKKVASIAPSIPEYSSPSIPEKSEYTPSIPPKCNVCVYANVEGGKANYCDKHEPMILRCPDFLVRESEPAAKPEGHLDPPIFPTNTPGTTPSHRASFSGARAGLEFSLKDKLKAQSALEAILGRNKKAIGGMVWPGLEIAKEIIDKLLA